MAWEQASQVADMEDGLQQQSTPFSGLQATLSQTVMSDHDYCEAKLLAVAVISSVK